MRTAIELHIPDDRIFLNFWNYHNGDDVIVELKENKLMLKQHDENGDDLPSIEISLIEFCNLVQEKMKIINNGNQ